MPIQDTSIELIQQAGQALHRARQALEGDIQASAQLITAAILHSAGKDSDQVFSGVKEVARLAHDLEAVEGRLKDLYLNAVSVAEHRAQRVTPLVQGRTARVAEMVLPVLSDVEDVQAKAPSARKAPKPRKAIKAPVKASPSVKAAKASATKRLGNDQKLLAFFSARLNAKAFTKVTGEEIRQGAGLPAGSVSASLGKLIKQGVLEQKDRGMYRLVKGKA